VVILETSEFIRRALTGEPIGLGERGEPDVLALREVERRCKSQTVKILGPVPAAPLEKLEQRERVGKDPDPSRLPPRKAPRARNTSL
jgi:antitoxin (DNA-binding transcriptional repressor) of toxin-antitoxin stability system